MRVSRHPNAVWVHAAVQTVGYITFMTAAGFGIWMANKVHAVSEVFPLPLFPLDCLSFGTRIVFFFSIFLFSFG